MRRDAVDFHEIPQHQVDIHLRLQNWARWCNGTAGSNVTPMFRGYRSTDVWIAPQVSAPVDTLDAARIAKAVIALPEKHRASMNWYYVKPVAPMKACRELAVNPEGLARLVVDSRQMLINRRA